MVFFKNKKGLTWNYLVMAIIALVVVVLVILWFKGGGEKGYGEVKSKLEGVKDCDRDGVPDMFDQCPCTPFGEKENSAAKGCPQNKTKDPEEKTKPDCCV